jgi:hypothetical protein
MQATDKSELYESFNEDIYYAHLIKGDFIEAIRYVKQFSEQAALYQRYMSVFDKEQYLSYDIDEPLNAILHAYQQYYRDIFYLCLDKDAAADMLRARLTALLEVSGANMRLDEMEQALIADEFRRRGFYFLGGKTGGCYGPYVWKTTEAAAYEVERSTALYREAAGRLHRKKLARLSLLRQGRHGRLGGRRRNNQLYKILL